MTFLKRFFGRKDISSLCMFVAILLKFALYLHFFQLEGDKLFQSLGAKNLAEGNGLTFQRVSPSDLSTIIFEPVNRWPPAYSLIIATLFASTRNLLFSCIMIDFISILLFFILLRKILKLLEFPVFVISILLLLNGAAFGMYISRPTDLLANVALLFSCYVALKFFCNTRISSGYGFNIGFVNVLPLFLRYMYLSTVFLIPALLIGAGFAKKEERLKTGGWYCLITTFLLSTAILLFQKYYTGTSSYVFLSGKEFYPENLLKLYPSALNAFIDINFIQLQINLLTGIQYTTLFDLAKALNGVLLIFLFFRFVFYAFKKHNAALNKWNFFVIVTGVTNIVIILMLCYLSVTNDPHSALYTSGLQWTFVEDERFYIFLFTTLPVIAAYYAFNIRWTRLRSLQKSIEYLFIALIFLQVCHAFYFIGKRFDPLALKGDNVLITPAVKNYLLQKIDESKKRGDDVVMTGNDETVSNWAVLNGQKGILNIRELNNKALKAKRPTVLLMLIEKDMLKIYMGLLIQKNIHFETQTDRLYIYSTRIVPD